ncbi:MAG: thiamine pyrophosphate-binding protein [Promethearchaeota archaeon]
MNKGKEQVKDEKSRAENHDIKKGKGSVESYHGGDALVDAIRAEGCDYVFGIPGGEFIDFLEAVDSRENEFGDIHYIGVRHEQAAANMADAYARVSGKVGVCCGTIGPGFADLVPGVAPAYFDSIPILVIHPQMDRKFEDHDRLQAGIDQMAIMKPIVKYQKSIDDPNRIIWAAQKCFKAMRNGRPRPAQLEVREDAFHSQVEDYGRKVLKPWQYRAIEPPAANSEAIKKAVELIKKAEKPFIVAGGGVTSSESWEELRELSLTYNIPVATSVMGIGTMSTNHETFIGSTLNNGGVMKAAKEADLVIALGIKFSYTMGYGKPPLWNPDAKVVQVDIDPQMIGKNRPVDVGILADCKPALQQLIRELKSSGMQPIPKDEWLSELKKARQMSIDMDKSKMNSNKTPIHPLRLIKEVTEFMEYEDILCSDAGDITVLTTGHIDYVKPRAPRTYLTSIGFGHLGVGIPYAIGAKLAKPDSNVFLITGDGAFLFNVQELDTAVHYNIPFVAVIADNSSWGMIENMEKRVFKKRPRFCVDLSGRDYVSIAKGFGCYAEKVEDPNELRPALKRAVDSGKPAVLWVPIRKYAPPGSKLMASFRALKF